MLVELSWRLALRRSCNCGKKTLVLYRRGVRRRPRDCSLGQFRAVLPARMRPQGIWAAWVFWFCSVPRNFRLPMNWPRRQPAMGYPLPASYRWRLSLTQRMIAGNSHWGSRLMVRSSSQFPSSVRVRPPNSYQTFLRNSGSFLFTNI